MASGPARSAALGVARRLILPAVIVWPALTSQVAQALGFAEADIFFELNASAGDLGIHVFLDAESWREVKIESPRGQSIAQVKPEGNLRRLGLTELFFEGSEPPLQQVPFAQFRAWFPEGQYVFTGKTVGNQVLRSTDRLSADLPCPVTVLSPEADKPVDPEKVVIRWKPAPGVYDPDTRRCRRSPGVKLTGYQVIAELVNEARGLLRIFSIDLPPDAQEVRLPANFLSEGRGLSDTEYKIEVLAIERDGNKTITEHEFQVEEGGGARLTASAAPADEPAAPIEPPAAAAAP